MIPTIIEKKFHYLSDLLSTYLPQPLPSKEQLAKTKIISHRGEYDNQQVFENTLPAFDVLLKYGVWGMEFDIRWSKDLVPLVIHDPTCERLFNHSIVLSEHTADDIRQQCPLIPTLSEVIERYGKKLHLMLEIKKEIYPEPEKQNQILKEHFNALKPMEDYHLLSLYPEVFDVFNFAPSTTYLPIVQLGPGTFSQIALDKQYGGLTGHYYLIPMKYVIRHLAADQSVGTGFIASQNCLFREVNRGVEWIFSNFAVKIQHILEQTQRQC